MGYASKTTVPEHKTRSEIETLLRSIGADQVGSSIDYAAGVSCIMFRWKGLQIAMRISLPDPSSKAFTRDRRGSLRNPIQALEEYEAECRRRMRCLLLALKAKVVSVNEGVTTVEVEFMPYIVTNNGQTVAERMLPRMIEAGALGAAIDPARLLE